MSFGFYLIKNKKCVVMIMAPDAINYEDVARIDNNMLNSDGI